MADPFAILCPVVDDEHIYIDRHGLPNGNLTIHWKHSGFSPNRYPEHLMPESSGWWELPCDRRSGFFKAADFRGTVKAFLDGEPVPTAVADLGKPVVKGVKIRISRGDFDPSVRTRFEIIGTSRAIPDRATPVCFESIASTVKIDRDGSDWTVLFDMISIKPDACAQLCGGDFRLGDYPYGFEVTVPECAEMESFYQSILIPEMDRSIEVKSPDIPKPGEIPPNMEDEKFRVRRPIIVTWNRKR